MVRDAADPVTLAHQLQFPFPQVRLALCREAADGQWWRLVTALFVHYDAAWQIMVVFACIVGGGVLVERIFGYGWWCIWAAG